MRVRRKTINGRFYYVLEESLRLDKPKVYSISLGTRVPLPGVLVQRKKELTARIYDDLLGAREHLYLTQEQLIQMEKFRRQYEARLKRLTPGQREEKDEIDTINFVYTTLTTEGVPITREDVDLAYRFSQKGLRQIRDENLQVSLDMVQGLRAVRESRKGLDWTFIQKLHAIIMAQYPQKHPGQLRTKPAYIYLRSAEKVEEIGFRPQPPEKITGKLRELTGWYNANLGRLNAIELAALLHLRFYAIHPFHDGNKRMSRLLLNKALLDSGYPFLNISKESAPYFDALIKSVEKKNEIYFVRFVSAAFERMCTRRGRTARTGK